MEMVALSLLQGMCPMCAGMGLWTVLFWIVVVAAVVAVVWLLVRRSRT
jgi:uncharacterized membrane protein